MAEVNGLIGVPPQAVWATLSDGWLYATWVIGTSKIRSVDRDFPAEGTKIHHGFGLWPVMIEDDSEVLECVPEQRMVLQARGWPMGEATTVIELQPSGTGTALRLFETPTKGPGAWVHNPLLEAMLHKRLTEMLDRLTRICEGRAGMTPRPD